MVAAILAATAGGNSTGCIVAMMPMREVTAARPVISEIDSSVVSQNSVAPPKPRHFDIENT